MGAHICKRNYLTFSVYILNTVQIDVEDITVNVHNRHADTKPLAMTSFTFSRLELGHIINRLNDGGNIVLSVAYNGNVADIVFIAKRDGWDKALFGES